ncbi:MAG: Crp/Fnr family transcriptional regulator [Lachnospiraceae bacterium]|nr:Crp/Fnr family transcriptional regulator [Lachnospiraceae bacterium]
MLPSKISRALTEPQRAFLDAFFAGCDEHFFSGISLRTLPANRTLIGTDDASCAYVYILLNGRLQAIEERVGDEPYRFAELSAIEIVGDFELFTKADSRIVTLTTLTPSRFLSIPSADYIAWIRQDANALFIRTQILIRQLVAQTRFERQNFFLDNRTRLLYFLLGECNAATAFPLRIQFTRQEISSKLGCSIRTTNRVIASLQNDGLFTLKHGKIWISSAQSRQIQERLQTLT